MNVKSPQDFINHLNNDMRSAMKSRDTTTTNALKSLLARISNAEAVDLKAINTLGVGSTEVSRRLLSEADIYSIIDDEINELQQALSSLESSPSRYTTELKDKIAILQRYKNF